MIAANTISRGCALWYWYGTFFADNIGGGQAPRLGTGGCGGRQWRRLDYFDYLTQSTHVTPGILLKCLVLCVTTVRPCWRAVTAMSISRSPTINP